MSLVWLTDATTNAKVAVNPKFVIAVFTPNDGPAEGKTVLSVINGSIPVNETELEVVQLFNSAGD